MSGDDALGEASRTKPGRKRAPRVGKSELDRALTAFREAGLAVASAELRPGGTIAFKLGSQRAPASSEDEFLIWESRSG